MATATIESKPSRVEEAAQRILQAFEDPQSLPRSLAPIFIHRKDSAPMRSWSFCNQLLAALEGTNDARGFTQWKDAHRWVKKGGHGFPILAPITKRVGNVVDTETGEERPKYVVTGFRSVIVFAVEQTEGRPIPEENPELNKWIEQLPLLDVARAWGIHVATYNGRAGAAQGKYRHGLGSLSIALGVENLSTWAHELMHAADDRLGNLVERGQHWRSEIVAEMGGAVLLECLGMPTEADLGGCYHYVKAYAEAAEIELAVACRHCLERVCKAVDYLLSSAEAMQNSEVAQ